MATSPVNPVTAPARRRVLLAALLPCAVGAALYLNTLPNGYVMDDFWIVQNNPLTRELSRIPQIFRTDVHWPSRHLLDDDNRGLYRPLLILSFNLNYLVSRHHASGYHLVNALLHGLVSGLVFLVALRLQPRLAPALVAATIFAVHPLHAEPVANIIGRADLLCALFSLVVIWTCLGAAADRPRRRRWLAGAWLGYALALLCKENAITLLAVPVLADWLLAGKRVGLVRTSKRCWPSWLGFAVVTVVYLLVRVAVLGRLSASAVSPFDNPLVAASFGQRLAGAVYIFGRYLWLCLWPSRLSSDYSYGVIPFDALPATLCFWLGLAALAAVIYGGWQWYRRGAAASLFCLVLFLAFYSLVSNTVLVIGVTMAERLFYQPSIALCLLFGLWLPVWLRSIAGDGRRAAVALTAVMLVVGLPLAARTWLRNPQWQSNLTLAEADTQSAPGSARLQLMLGRCYVDLQRPAEAIAPLEASLQVMENPMALRALGQAYGDLRERDKQRQALARACRIAANDPLSWGDAGRAAMAAGELAEAVTCLTEAVRLDPQNQVLRLDLADAHFRAQAYGTVTEVLAPLNIDDAFLLPRERRRDYYRIAGVAAQKSGHAEAAAEIFAQGLARFADDLDLVERLAYLEYAELDRPAAALVHYRRLLDLAPTHPQAAAMRRAVAALERRLEPADPELVK